MTSGIRERNEWKSDLMHDQLDLTKPGISLEFIQRFHCSGKNVLR